MLRILLIILVINWVNVSSTWAYSEGRNFKPILQKRTLPKDAIEVEQLMPVAKEAVHEELVKIAKVYNQPELRDHLSDNFVDRDRLVDTIATTVPRDAQLEVLNTSNVQTLDQYWLPNPEYPGGYVLVSDVVANARFQLIFNSPARGFVRPESTGELRMTIKEYFKPSASSKTKTNTSVDTAL